MDVRWVLVGEIVASQGNQGEVKVFPHTEFPTRFGTMERVCLFSKFDQDKPDRVYEIEGSRLHKDHVILKLSGVDSIGEAEALRGMKIQVPKDEVVPLPEGRHYIYELIGLDVVTTSERLIGKISDVLQTGANDVYVVKPVPGVTQLKEVLIPVIEDVVRDIDLDNKVVRIELMDGLLD